MLGSIVVAQTGSVDSQASGQDYGLNEVKGYKPSAHICGGNGMGSPAKVP